MRQAPCRTTFWLDIKSWTHSLKRPKSDFVKWGVPRSLCKMHISSNKCRRGILSSTLLESIKKYSKYFISVFVYFRLSVPVTPDILVVDPSSISPCLPVQHAVCRHPGTSPVIHILIIIFILCLTPPYSSNKLVNVHPPNRPFSFFLASTAAITNFFLHMLPVKIK